MRLVIIKINKMPKTTNEIIERGKRAWVIKLPRVSNQTLAAILYRGNVLVVCKILDCKQDDIQMNRVAFQFEEIEHYLKGKKIKYPTSNPCTIADEKNLVII